MTRLQRSLGRTIPSPALILLVAAPMLTGPGSASAQIRPGIERGDYWGEVRARYRNEVLEDVGDTMERWLSAWNNDDAAAIAETFAEDGLLILDNTRSGGSEAIQAAFEGTLPAVGAIEYGLVDFDVRGEMAFATTRFQYSRNGGDNGRSEVTGHLVWIMVKHDDGWRIRSQIFQTSGETHP
jgi:uncharacterized protein (TIGR02246 family)